MSETELLGLQIREIIFLYINKFLKNKKPDLLSVGVAGHGQQIFLGPNSPLPMGIDEIGNIEETGSSRSVCMRNTELLSDLLVQPFS